MISDGCAIDTEHKEFPAMGGGWRYEINRALQALLLKLGWSVCRRDILLHWKDVPLDLPKVVQASKVYCKQAWVYL